MKITDRTAGHSASSAAIVVRALGVEVRLPGLLTLLAAVVVIFSLLLVFACFVILHVTAWADADGIAKILRAISP